MDKSEAINKVRAYQQLIKLHFNPVKVYIFGSYAKNNYRAESDIDVAIVVDEMKGNYFAVNPLLWKLRRQIDDRIEPILIERNFDDGNFLEEIEKNGIEIV